MGPARQPVDRQLDLVTMGTDGRDPATDVVDARRGSLLLDTDTSILSLVTCYPFDAAEAGGPLRYVVTARKVY